MRVLLLSPLPAEAVTANLPQGLGVEVVTLEERTQDAVLRGVSGIDFVMGDYSGEIAVTADVVAAMDRVRLFHQPTTGYDQVDVDACARQGIPVTNAGRATSVAMAEHSVMVTLALLKSLVWCDQQVRDGAWPQHEVVGRSLVDLQGKTVGLVGFGGAGEETSARLRPFGCRILYNARQRRPEPVERDHGMSWADRDVLLTESDVVILLADLNPSTRHLIDAEALERMKASAFLVNPARGGLVDEAALVQALRMGAIAGAALDVFQDEPLAADSPLRDLGNVILTPHVGGATLETRLRMLQRSFEVIASVARGALPDGVVNGVKRLRVVA